jgi:hypothetical protein
MNEPQGIPMCPDHNIPMTKKGFVLVSKKPRKMVQRYECPQDHKTYTSPIWQSTPQQLEAAPVPVRKATRRRPSKDAFDF